MILHASEHSSYGKRIHFVAQDTHLLVLALRRYPLLGPKTAVVIWTGEISETVSLKPIYESLGPLKAGALPGFHCITGCVIHVSKSMEKGKRVLSKYVGNP